jgi:hypothetical protein
LMEGSLASISVITDRKSGTTSLRFTTTKGEIEDVIVSSLG